MTRRAPPREKYEPLNLRMPTDLLDALDAEVQREQEAHPGRNVTRSEVIREALWSFVRAREKARRR